VCGQIRGVLWQFGNREWYAPEGNGGDAEQADELDRYGIREEFLAKNASRLIFVLAVLASIVAGAGAVVVLFAV
jgi:hypothetical protein